LAFSAGGACSIAVFDNDMGTSSISPLLVTGGKEGDVGLHDFRYIATGKTKRHRHSNTVERITDIGALDVRSELSSRVGDQNRHGMLWYIPKAHSGNMGFLNFLDDGLGLGLSHGITW